MRATLTIAALALLVIAGAEPASSAFAGGGSAAVGPASAGANSIGLETPYAESFVAPELALITSLDAREELLEVGAGGVQEPSLGENPALMGLASLMVPGSGQLIQGNKRGYLFLLAEVALWGGFYALDNRGDDARDDYEDFANANWNREDYLDWFEENCVECEDCAGDYDCRPLATYDTQEYYEDIGKYNTYWRWWNIDGDEGDIAWDEYGDADTYVRNQYWDMRDDSNRYLRQARYLSMAAFLNHMLAAVDSFFTARGAGSREAGPFSDLGLEFDVAEGGEGLSCALTARY